MYFMSLSNQMQAYILTYFLSIYLLPTCDQVHTLCSWCNQCKHTSWHTSCLCISCLHVIKYTPYAGGAINLIYRSKNTRFAILHEQSPAFQEVFCTWASGAYSLEAFVLYSSLKHSNLNLNHNVSHNNVLVLLRVSRFRRLKWQYKHNGHWQMWQSRAL